MTAGHIDTEAIYRQNKSLVYHMMDALHVDRTQYEDAACKGLEKAVYKYDPQRHTRKGKFSTFACRVIQNAIIDEYRKQSAQKRKTLHLENVGLTIDDEWVNVLDTLPYASFDIEMEQAIELQVDLAPFLEQLKYGDRQLLLLLYQGYTQKEIAQHLHLSQATISRRILQFRERAEDVFYDYFYA